MQRVYPLQPRASRDPLWAIVRMDSPIPWRRRPRALSPLGRRFLWLISLLFAGMVMSALQQPTPGSSVPEEQGWTQLERCNFFIFFPAGCN